MRKIFGTDGVRGQANHGAMTPLRITELAMAAASHFIKGDHRHTVVIGKDTRLSGYMVESALTSGLTSMGYEVVLLGPLPTPAVAMLTKSLRADFGIMISASHNPYHDNGIKFFDAHGYKLSDLTEHAIESRIERGNYHFASYDHIGKARILHDAPGRYIEYAKATFPKNIRLDSLKIVLDCAHGAAYKVAPAVLWELGAQIIPIGTHPDGFNINKDCGATSTEAARQKVLEENADLAIILDGDADRIMLVDNKGRVLDGDKILALVTSHFIKEEKLKGPGIVATHMSNLGLERYIKGIGLEFMRANVGDRYVIDRMKHSGANIGGEQSGHIILTDHSTTGDGLMAALQVLAIMMTQEKSLFELGHIYDTVPQVLHNLRLTQKIDLQSEASQKMITQAKNRLGHEGYLLVRPSGTEPVLRLMAQGDHEDTLSAVIHDLADAFQKESKERAA